MDFKKLKGKFITFEGIEGSGKSTQSKLLVDYLNKNGVDAVWTREPGGSVGAEEIRNLLISGGVDKWDKATELLLFYAARRDHVERKIKPLLEEGRVVISDRFFDSTTAYQGYGYKINLRKIKTIQKIALENFEPDLTIVFDLDSKEGLKRANKRGDVNRYEAMELAFHKRVRNGFLKIAEKNKERVKVLEIGNKNLEEVQKEIIKLFSKYLLK